MRLVYANRLTAAINKHGKPEGVPAADWERKKNAELSRGYYMAGVISAEKGQYVPADKNLRASLPLIQGQPTMMGPALFYLGMANYQLGKMTLNKAKMLEAVKFSEQSMAIDSPYADQARHNALVIKDEAARMRGCGELTDHKAWSVPTCRCRMWRRCGSGCRRRWWRR